MAIQKRLEGHMTMKEIATYAKVTRQAVYVALTKGLVKAVKHDGVWFIKKEDYDDYRSNKYNKDLRKRDGENIYDLDKGLMSVSQVSKTMSASLGRHYSISRIYFKLRRGDLKAHRRGCAWVIMREDAIDLLNRELAKREAKNG